MNAGTLTLTAWREAGRVVGTWLHYRDPEGAAIRDFGVGRNTRNNDYLRRLRDQARFDGFRVIDLTKEPPPMRSHPLVGKFALSPEAEALLASQPDRWERVRLLDGDAAQALVPGCRRALPGCSGDLFAAVEPVALAADPNQMGLGL